MAQQRAEYARQQREIAHIEDFVRRFRAKATKAKQAQSRLKALERMETVAPAHADSPFYFHFDPVKPAIHCCRSMIVIGLWRRNYSEQCLILASSG